MALFGYPSCDPDFLPFDDEEFVAFPDRCLTPERQRSPTGTSMLSIFEDEYSNSGEQCDTDALISFESDEEIKQVNVSETPPHDARAKTLHALELIALSFLRQVVSDRVELTLVSRNKALEDDGSFSRRAMRWPSRSKNGSFRRFARLLRVIDLICDALTNGVPTTKREIFYQDVSLFRTQTVVDVLVDDLAATIGATRSDLNVRASAKGLFFGSGLKIHLEHGGVVLGNNAEAAVIPSGADISHLEVRNDVGWVLVVEKEAVFQTLCRCDFGSDPLCPGSGIIITGKGYPDLATRELVCRLSRSLPVSTPILALVDADPHGLEILSVYKYGSLRLIHEGCKTITPRIEWLGVHGSELTKLGIDRDKLLHLTKHDHKKALDMLVRGNTLPVQWRRELSHMLHLRRKSEIEILSSASTIMSDNSLLHHSLVQDVFQLDETPSGKSTLVLYIASKLHSWVYGSSWDHRRST